MDPLSRLRLFILAFALIAILPRAAFAHGVSEGGSDDFNLQTQMDVWSQTMEQAPDILANENDHVTAVPILNVRGQKIKMNSAFWGLVTQWVRIYYQEFQRDCPECVAIPLDQLTEEVQAQVARGFWSAQVLEPILNKGKGLASVVTDTASQQGPIAGAATAIFEVAEDVALSQLAINVHVFCNLIQASVAYWSNHVSTAVRMFTISNGMELSGARTFFMQAMLASSIRRAQKRVQFEMPPFEVDDEALGDIDKEGPKRLWGFLKDGKRASWLKGLEKDAQKPIAELTEIETKLAQAPDDEDLLKRRNGVLNRLSKNTRIDGRAFRGQRYKRFLLMISRKNTGDYLRGQTDLDKRFAKKPSLLWIMSIQEGILHRGLLKKENPFGDAENIFLRPPARSPSRANDPIREGIAQEYSVDEPARTATLEKLLQDIDVIFDPTVSKEKRYLMTAVIENFFQGFYFKSLVEGLPDIPAYRKLGFLNILKMRWTAGRFYFRVEEFIDFMRVASVSKSSEALMNTKYEAMEVVLDLFDHIQMTKEASRLRSVDELMEYRDDLAEFNRMIKAKRPWREKRSVYSWIPFRQPIPTCEDLDKAI